jgi:serine phosphatase RsbU (regulator of sigma subunit)
MRAEEVLSATGIGFWRWVSATGASTIDARTAHLLGMSDAPEHFDAYGHREISESTFRSRVHVIDYVELQSVSALCLAERRLAEVLLRIIGDDGAVARTVRLRMFPEGEGSPAVLIGTMADVPEPTAGQRPVTGDWQRSREAFLLDAGRALAEARSTNAVMRVAASLSMPGFTPDRLVLFGLEGRTLKLIGHYGEANEESVRPFLEMPLHYGHPAPEAARTGRAVYLPTKDAFRHRYPESWPDVERLGHSAWAFLPLTYSGHTIGAWMAAFRHPVSFTPDERAVLVTVARMLAQALSRAKHQETERKLSSALLRTMRPAHMPVIERMTVATRYVPTGGGLQVGGDWYDVIPLPSGRTALVIGDVQGHDVQAAGIMAHLRIALRAYASEGHHPDGVLNRASRFLAGMKRPEWVTSEAEEAAEESELLGSAAVGGEGRDEEGGRQGDQGGKGRDPTHEDRFATCLYVEVDPATGTLDLARAGHPDPAIWLADGTMLVRPTAGGLPLGIEPDTDYPTTRLVLEPGETLLLCTDGLLETGGHDMETGWERVKEIFQSRPEGSRGPGNLDQLADDVIETVLGPPSRHTTGPPADRREDDIALLLLTYEEDFPSRAEVRDRATVRRTVLTVAQAEPDRVAGTRHQLQNLLYDWQSEDQVDGAVLMLSEMLTNVLVHTDGDALVAVEISGESGHRLLRVEVADASDELPHRRRPGELASSGRGLVLMEMLAGAWGVDPRGKGKSIWFEMRENAPPPHLE